MKSFLINAFGSLGGYQLARILTAREPKILMYHRFSAEKKGHEVTAATFEKQLKMIKRYFNPMTLAQLAQYIAVHKRAPKHAVVITVDDGYRDFYEVAYPLLKRYQVPATFFVTTGFVSGDLWLWPDQVLWLLKNKVVVNKQVQLGDLQINLALDASALWFPIVNYFLQIPDEKRLNYLAQLSDYCGLVIPATTPEAYAASDWQQLSEMQAQGIEIGGHTVSHPSLGHQDLAKADAEIKKSFADLQKKLGDAPRTFCYPNGQPEDYSEPIKESVKKTGYIAAVTAYSDAFNTTKPYAWRRFVGSEDSFQFKKSLFGFEHLGNRLRKSRRCDY